MLAADRARRGLQFGGRGQGGDSSPPIPTSPVLVRRASTFARALPIGLDDQVDANGGRATFSHGSGKLLSLAVSGGRNALRWWYTVVSSSGSYLRVRQLEVNRVCFGGVNQAGKIVASVV